MVDKKRERKKNNPVCTYYARPPYIHPLFEPRCKSTSLESVVHNLLLQITFFERIDSKITLKSKKIMKNQLKYRFLEKFVQQIYKILLESSLKIVHSQYPTKIQKNCLLNYKALSISVSNFPF